ncbi:DUF1704 domain-containing protein [Candidatus Woesebacteria bacterium]|nr:DUF1704 domain-containing protein [Candidatus Woesebacteria bacterium]
MKLAHLIPSNLEEEKEKFFASRTYNPQFEYAVEIDPAYLTRYPAPEKKIFDLSQEILREAYTSETEQSLFEREGRVLTQGEVKHTITTYLQEYDLHTRYTVLFSPHFIARAAINSSELKIRLPIEHREHGLISTLHHEVGTHALRRLNDEQQPWHGKRAEFNLQPHLVTEEGLATFHSILEEKNPSAYIRALRYFAVYLASTSSFREVWNALDPYVDNLERRWRIVLRAKRGVRDTSTQQFFNKDSVYFSGMIHVWQWYKKNNFNLPLLYCGKVATEDIERAAEHAHTTRLLLPKFYTNSPDRYKENIATIAQYNHFDQV